MRSRSVRFGPVAVARGCAVALALPLALVLAHAYRAPLLAGLHAALSSPVWPQAARTVHVAWVYTFHPPLPPAAALVATVSRICAILFLVPLVVLVLVDVASYAVFRTLGLRRVRVRVRPRRPRSPLAAASAKEPGFVAWPGPHAQFAYRPTHPAHKGEQAPLLTPGTYDASTLLAHRKARASSAAHVPSIVRTPPPPRPPEDPGEIDVQDLAAVDPSPVDEQEPGKLDVGVHGPLGWDTSEDESDASAPSTPRPGCSGLSPTGQHLPAHLQPLADGVRRRTTVVSTVESAEPAATAST